MATCVKHFPGHGDTVNDSHDGYVSVEKNWEELLSCEIIPFETAIANSTDMIMIAHITLPNVTSDLLPASLSYEIITEKLRNELNYNGLVITDALGMGAVANNYTAAEAAVLTFKAGTDILLMPANFTEAYNAILTAVNSGDISIDRLNESVYRILSLKASEGLLN